MKPLGDLLRDLAEPDSPVSDDARAAIAEGLEAEAEYEGLPLGHQGVEVVEP